MTFNPFLSYIYVNIDLKPTYIGMYACVQRFFEFSLMCVRTTYLLDFHMPRDRSDLTLHYPFGILHKEPIGYIEGEELKGKRTIVHCCRSLLILESTSLCPLEHLGFFPSFPFIVILLLRDGGLRLWRTQFLRFTDVLTKVVIHVISDLC